MFFGIILACAITAAGTPSETCLILKDPVNPYGDRALCLIEVDKHVGEATNILKQTNFPHVSGSCYSEKDLTKFPPEVRKEILKDSKNVY